MTKGKPWNIEDEKNLKDWVTSSGQNKLPIKNSKPTLFNLKLILQQNYYTINKTNTHFGSKHKPLKNFTKQDPTHPSIAI